jgi:hypothetical protein
VAQSVDPFARNEQFAGRYALRVTDIVLQGPAYSVRKRRGDLAHRLGVSFLFCFDSTRARLVVCSLK